MLVKQKFGIAITGIILGFAAVIIPASQSTANPVFVNKSNQRQVSKVKMAPLALSKLGLANIEIANNKSIPCLTQQNSLAMNSVELLMRLLIIGSFGSVSLAGSSSLVQRYLQILNRNYLVIAYCAVGLLLILLISNVIIFVSSSRNQSFASSCSKSNLI
jgi:uncharacterized protein involved in cysteine biosynthesis